MMLWFLLSFVHRADSIPFLIMKLFHLTNRLFAKTVCLQPVTGSGSETFEVSTPKRICFSDSIQRCANALHGYSSEQSLRTEFTVYQIEITGNEDFYVPNQYIVRNKLVFDADQHGECWITKPVVAHRIAKVKLHRTNQRVIFKPLRKLPDCRYLKNTDQTVYNIIKVSYRDLQRTQKMNSIGIDDFELEQLKKCQQISKQDFEKYKLKQIEREVNVSDYEKYKLTQTLKELAGTVKNKEKWE